MDFMSAVYERLRQCLDTFPIHCPPGKGILEFLRIAFTEEEAELLSQLTSFQKFVAIEEFAKKHGYPADRVRKIFQKIAKRNLIRFEEKGGIERYCPHPFVIGLFESYFSAWRAQDPDMLRPAAQAVADYFDEVFYKAASGSTSPWARVIPAVGPIKEFSTTSLNPNQDTFSSASNANSYVRRSANLFKFGAKELGKRLQDGNVQGMVDLVREDGGVILDSIMKGISSFFQGSPKQSKRPAPQSTMQSGIESYVTVNQTLPATMQVLPFEVISQYIDEASNIIIAPCSCRTFRKLLREQEGKITENAKPCTHTIETCMQFRYGDAKPHEYNMMGGRVVSKEEAIAIIEKCEKEGLVHVTFNSREQIEFICNCCPCCCGILGTMTRYHQRYRAFVESNFIPQLRSDACAKCGRCATVCPVAAIAYEKSQVPQLDVTKCIGCGICASNCAKKALTLKKVRSNIPQMDAIEAYVQFSNQKVQ